MKIFGKFASTSFFNLKTSLMFVTLMGTNIEINPTIKRLRLKIESYINNKTNLDKYLSTNLKRILNFQKEIEQNSQIKNLNKNITKMDLSQS